MLNKEKILELVEKIEELEKRLEQELDDTNICFDKFVKDTGREYKKSILKYLKDAPLLYVLTAPFIYFLIIPALFLDISVSIYQAVNFKVYNIKKVKRGEYIVFDRHRLSYLNFIEKLNCVYCSYFNGLIAYVSEVSAKTEQFWCPIQHAKKIAYRHSTYVKFLPFGDGKKYRKYLEELRKELGR